MKKKVSTDDFKKYFSIDSSDVILKNCKKLFLNDENGLQEQIRFLEYCAKRLKPLDGFQNDNDDTRAFDYRIIVSEIEFRNGFLKYLMAGKVDQKDFDRFRIINSKRKIHMLESPFSIIMQQSKKKFEIDEEELRLLFLKRHKGIVEASIPFFNNRDDERALQAEIDMLEESINNKNFINSDNSSDVGFEIWPGTLETLFLQAREEAHKQVTSENEIFEIYSKKYKIRTTKRKNEGIERVLTWVTPKKLKDARDRCNSKSAAVAAKKTDL